MYTGTQPVMVLQQDCDSAVTFVTTVLKSSGYTVVECFDLHTAMAAQEGSACEPNSSTYQMVVLLLYPRKGLPISLVFNSHDLQTAVYLTNCLNKPIHSRWVGKLTHLILEDPASPHPANP